MTINFTFKKSVHVGAAFQQLKGIFKTAEIEKEGDSPAEIVVGFQDFEKNKKDFPNHLAIKLDRIRTGRISLIEYLAFGVSPFDNKNCQAMIEAITK
jgi:hypothetical protein